MQRINYSSIRLEITSGCNLNCEYCHNSKYNNMSNDLKTDELLKLIADLKAEYDIKKILLTGGEPLMQKDLCTIIAFATSLGIKVDMVTNGTMLTDNYVASIERAGLKRIRISIDDVTSKGTLRGNYNPDKLWNMAKKINANANIEVCIHTVCSPSNVKQLFEVYKKVLETGAKRWRVFDLGYEGNVTENRDKFSFNQYYKDLIDITKRILEDYISNNFEEKLDIEINNIFRTMLLKCKPLSDFDVKEALTKRLEASPCDYVADHQLTIRSDGKATLCQYFHNTIYDFKAFEMDVNSAIKNAKEVDESKILMKDLQYCSKCKYVLVCNSGCRARAKFLTGDILDADPCACYIVKKICTELLNVLPENSRLAYEQCIYPDGAEPKYDEKLMRQLLKANGY